MKRATASLKRNNRRNKNQGATDKDGGATSNETTPASVEQQHQPRKPTPEEAALTAKNYRLAKELSDLRVRHREECKNVTKLTMENMNLASRCREAISHVSMLKKELVIHQRRTAEALAFQRQQALAMRPTAASKDSSIAADVTTNAVAEGSRSTSSSLSDVAAEMDRMDRILAAHAAQPPPPPPPPKQPSQKEQTTAGNTNMVKPDVPALSGMKSGRALEVAVEEKKTPEVTPSPSRSQVVSTDNVFFSTEFKDPNKPPSRPPKSPASQPRSQESPVRGGNGLYFRAEFEEAKKSLGHESDENLRISSNTPRNTGKSPKKLVSTSRMHESLNDIAVTPPKSSSLSPMRYTEKLTENISADENRGALFPMSASPQMSIAKVSPGYTDAFPGELRAVRSVRSAERKPNNDFGGITEQEDETSTNSPPNRVELDTPSLQSHSRQWRGPDKLSSLDAFEASFTTLFPDSFSPVEQMNRARVEIYNPFFPSPSNHQPTKDANGNFRSQTDWESNAKGTSNIISPRPNLQESAAVGGASAANTNGLPLLSDFMSSKSSASPVLSHRFSTAPPETKLLSVEPISTPQKSMIHNGNDRSELDSGFRTPPHIVSKSPDSSSSEPKRPEKTGGAAARARYEKALQPRTNSNSSRQFGVIMDQPALESSKRGLGSGDKHEDPALRLASRSEENVAGSRDNLVKAVTAPIQGKTLVRTSLQGRQNTVDTDSMSKPWDEDDDISNQNCVPAHTPILAHGSDVMRMPIGKSRPWEGDALSSDSSSYENSAPPSILQETSQSTDPLSAASHFVATGKQRRNVRRPLSYTEPSLVSKLRKGHVYFPKDNINGNPIIDGATNGPEKILQDLQCSSHSASVIPS